MPVGWLCHSPIGNVTDEAIGHSVFEMWTRKEKMSGRLRWVADKQLLGCSPPGTELLIDQWGYHILTMFVLALGRREGEP